MTFNVIFQSDFPIIGCIHLQPLPGSPGYQDNLDEVLSIALEEAKLLAKYPVNGLIVENFGDVPFYPDRVPPITVAAMTRVVTEIKRVINLPIGVNVLRNDAHSAIAIASATQAEFIRVNIHMHSMITDQGIIEGKSFETLRLRKQLGSQVLILADVNVKHADSLVKPDLVQWTHDLVDRGKADALIVTGSGTGKSVDYHELNIVKDHSEVPVLIGSGANPANMPEIAKSADGAIVGSYFKMDGKVTNPVSEVRLKNFFNTSFR